MWARSGQCIDLGAWCIGSHAQASSKGLESKCRVGTIVIEELEIIVILSESPVIGIGSISEFNHVCAACVGEATDSAIYLEASKWITRTNTDVARSILGGEGDISAWGNDNIPRGVSTKRKRVFAGAPNSMSTTTQDEVSRE